MADRSAQRLTSFKAYDVRGRVPDELNVDLARRIGRAYAAWLEPSRIVVGHDIRLSSPELAQAFADGLLASGVEVLDIGQCGTEQVYFATFHLGLDGGVMVTASHNPSDYNGFKLVREGSRPISADTGLHEIERRTLESDSLAPAARASVKSVDVLDDYIAHLLSYIDVGTMKPLKIVSNAGNGGAGHVIDLLERHLPFEFIKVHHEPDGRFPNGVPNPLLPENRAATAEAVVAEGADFGVAWDGDFDRCFLFDEKGTFIEGYYIVGLLAAGVLERRPGGRIVHDPRLTWNTLEVVRESGGVPVQCKSGHAFIKDVMRREEAVYGGEMSAHHYFQEFSYCDSGMVPWMLVAQLVSTRGLPLSRLVGDRVARFPASGEINRRIDDPRAALERVRAHYAPTALSVDETDGVGLEFERWRFNLRLSNTEPLIRLNVESRGDEALMREKTDEVLALLEQGQTGCESGEGCVLELGDQVPIFIGFRLETAVRRQLESLDGPDRKYVSADDSTFLRICRIGDTQYVGKLIHERLGTDRIDDILRNVTSIMQRLCPETRFPEKMVILACPPVAPIEESTQRY